MAKKNGNEKSNKADSGPPCKYTQPLRPPIAATVAYQFESFQHCADTYGHRVQSHAYSRLSNPTMEALEERITVKEGAHQTVAFASGMAAISALYMGLCRPGNNIVSSARLYGGTLALQQRVAEFGVSIRYADFSDPKSIESNIDEKTIMVFSEPIANPAMDWYDFEDIYRIAKRHNVLCVLDNTNTIALFDAMQYSDIEIVSATKYVGGHGAGLGGLAICGEFDLSDKRYQGANTPSGDFGGKRPSDTGANAIPNILRGSQLRNFGGCMSPFNAFIFTLGLDTLDLRMRDISRRTLAIAQLCEKHPAVDLVFHAEIGPKAKGVDKYFPNGTGGLFSFRLKGDESNVKRFFEALELIPVATNIGDSRTIVQHVETTSHSQLSPEQLEAAGIPRNLLRVSMGLESLEDLTEEFQRALANAQTVSV